MDVELRENVFDVIIYGSGADVELISDSSRAVAFGEALQNFNFSGREADVDAACRQRRNCRPAVLCLRPYKLT